MRKILKWTGISLGVLLIILVLFHRPIFFRLTRYFVVRAAEHQNLAIDYQIDGSIFSSLRVTNLHATPTQPGTVERLEVGRIDLEYSLWGLLRHGLPGFLERATLKDAFVTIDPSKRSAVQHDQKAATKFPALIPKELTVENVNFTVRLPGDDFIISDFNLVLDPTRKGWLRAETLQLPGVHTWTSIKADASYKQRNLILTGLDLGPEIQLRELKLDMSKLDRDTIEFGLRGKLFAGQVNVSGTIADLHEANNLTLSLNAESNSLTTLSTYFGFVPPLAGTLKQITAKLSGMPAKPQTWSGTAKILVADFTGGPIAAAMDADLMVKINDGKAVIETAELHQGRSSAWATATVNLPETLDHVAQTVKGGGTFDADLKDFGPLSGYAVKGAVDVQGDFTMADGTLHANIHGESQQLSTGDAELTNADLHLQIEKSFSGNTAPFWKGLKTTVNGTAANARWENYEADSAEFDITTRDEHVQVRKLNIVGGDNKAELSGEFVMPKAAGKVDKSVVNLALNVDARDLKQLIAEKTGRKLEGNLSLHGHVARQAGRLSGTLSLSGSGINYAGVAIPQVSGDIAISAGLVQVKKFQADLTGKGSISASGTYDLNSPNAYHGKLHFDVKDLSTFEPLVQRGHSGTEMSGALTVDWRGTGTLHPGSHDGAATIVLRDGGYNAIKDLNADISGVYSPKSIQVPTFDVSSDAGSATADIDYRDQTLRVRKLLLRQEKLDVVRGEITLPVDVTKLATPAKLLRPDGPVAINLTSKKLDLAKLAALNDYGARGTLTANLQASGTLDHLQASLEMHGKSLYVRPMGKLAGVAADFRLDLADDRLKLDATLRQPKIQPLTVSGNVPFDVTEVMRDRRIDASAPVDLSVKLAPSDLSFIREIVPAIRYAEGTVAIEANVKGTIHDPELNGSATLHVPALRMRNVMIPNISDSRMELRLHGRTLSVENARMTVAGGPLSASGSVQFQELADPKLDLHLNGKSVLILRNDSTTVRANIDLALTGPLASAHVAGTVGVTQSRFFRDIEILPISLPGRPAPAPGVPETATTFSITTAPIRDWTFDVAIKTADPFKIRGNLAHGNVLLDLRLTGTGRNPSLDGTASAGDFVLSLPFTRLRLTRGAAYFSPGGAVANPKLDFNGVAEIRDYRINVYIYGTATDPQTVFSSEPPLPQEEIITLLATGATREELTGDANVAAGRAGWLLLQKLYRKVFGGADDKDGDNDFLDRFDVSPGPVDPRTGAQSITARFRIDKNWMLLATTGIGGGVRGQVKYLVRFR